MRLLPRSITLKAISLAFVSAYVGAVILSMVLAHVLIIWMPQSGAAQRIAWPVARGLEFLDVHWKSILVLLALPFVAPFIKDLIARITKIWGIEFAIPLEPIGGVREKKASSVVGVEPIGVREKPSSMGEDQ
jgi:hypothetical protein